MNIILNIIQIIFGLLIGLFIPGYLVATLFFKELNQIEKIGLAFVFSIAIDIILGLYLGYNETMKNLTGGLTAMNLWVYLSAITLVLCIINLIKYKKIKLPSRKSGYTSNPQRFIKK